MEEDFDLLTIQELKQRIAALDIKLTQNKLYRKPELINILQTALKPQKPAPAQDLTGIPSKQMPRNIAYRQVQGENQHSTDVFKQAMGEINNEDIDQINRESWSVDIWEFLFVVLLLVALAFLVHLGSGFLISLVKQQPFCSTKITEDCLPCPEHAICDEGKMHCVTPYIRKRNACVEDQRVVKDAYYILELLEAYLEEQSINAYMENRSKYSASLSSIKAALQTDSIIHFEESFSRIYDLLPSNPNLNIEHSPDDLFLSLKTLKLTYSARLTLAWQDYKLIIFSLLLLILALSLIILRTKQKFFLRSKAREIYQMITQQLQANVNDSYDHGLTEDNIMETISQQLGPKVAENIWPYLENLRKGDPRTCKFEVLIGGRPHVLWQWKVNALQGGKLKVG